MPFDRFAHAGSEADSYRIASLVYELPENALLPPTQAHSPTSQGSGIGDFSNLGTAHSQLYHCYQTPLDGFAIVWRRTELSPVLHQFIWQTKAIATA